MPQVLWLDYWNQQLEWWHQQLDYWQSLSEGYLWWPDGQYWSTKWCLYQTSNIGCSCNAVSLAIELRASVTGEVYLATGLLRPLAQWPSDQMGEGKLPCVFWKVFYQIFKDKKFYNFLLKILLTRKNIYEFDYILLTNKFLKMEKYFTRV